MARAKSEDKRAAIARATIEEVVSSGFAGASIERIARRAGLAVGTVYRYFDNREALLREVHLDVKRELHARLMRAVEDAADTSRARIEAAWFALLDVALERPAAFRFAEAVAAQGRLSETERKLVARLDADVQALLQEAIDAGAIAPASPRALTALLVAPAMRLAHEAATSGAPSPELAREVFALIWRGLRGVNE